jgi:hypothetical protein
MKYILLLSTSLILLSCSKSKKIEKNVIGTWNISEFYNSIQTTTQTSTYFSDTTVYNIGTLTFKNDGTGKFDVPSFNTDSFKWTNDKENIYLEFNNSTQLDTLEIIESSKNKLILHTTDIGYPFSGIEKYQYKYTLTK